MKTLLRRATAMIAIIALAVTLLPLSALAEAKTSFVRSQIDSRPAKPDSEAAAEIEIVPHKTDNPKRSEIWDGSIATSFAGGSGTQEDPYLISNGSELAYLAQEVNNGNNSYSGVYFKLTNDIYLNDTSNWESWGNGITPQNEWTAIGGYRNDEDEQYDYNFNGCFDGDGYAVRGIYINTQEYYQGLFGYIGEGSIIANLGVAESYVGGYSCVGGVVGANRNSTVTNCYNMGSISGEESIGGVIGLVNNGGTVTDCYNMGSVSGKSNVGGMVGWNYSAVTNCYNTGNVSGKSNVGGVVGYNFIGTVTDCYNTGSVNGKERIGGVVGTNAYDDATIISCYNMGSVNGVVDVGGVVGANGSGTVTNCYYLDICCANGDEYGTALTDEQMQASESFISFDFVEVWTMDGNPEYPYPELVGNIHGGLPGTTTEPGDANGDGNVTIADATLISRMALNLTDSVPAADFNGDGSINMADATLTARKALNLI